MPDASRKRTEQFFPYEQGTKATVLDFMEGNGEDAIVTQSQADQPNARSDCRGWSNRILILAMAGILFLTCFPFRLVSHAKLPHGASAFLLGGTFGKHTGPFDDFLNVLLFIPLGFGLSDKLLEKRKSRAATFLVVWFSGIFLSYAIEFAQLHIPGRDSGWEDVITNSSGAAVGFFVFVAWGGALMRWASRTELALESFATLRRIAVVLLAYFACWFAFSARMQKETRLGNWLPDARMFVGNDAAGKSTGAWKGEVSKVQIWDRSLPPQVAAGLTSGAVVSSAAPPPPLAEYDFANGAPFRDTMGALPDLTWSAGAEARDDPGGLVLDGGAWLVSAKPVSNLALALQRTNKFAIHVICKPASGEGADGDIVSIERVNYLPNMSLRQEGTSLVFWFRNSLAPRPWQLPWTVPNVFVPNRSRTIVYSYDGSTLSLYLDGRRGALTSRLGPGAALARVLRNIRPAELDGYRDIYYSFLFFPAGVVLGISARTAGGRRMAAWWFIAFWLVVSPLLLEWVLIAVSGRTLWPGNLILSWTLLAFGALWINADGRLRMRAAACGH
jgi:VanZ like family